MNIVKLKDIMINDDSEFAKFFNENLKGKYAFWVQMRYIFPLHSLSYRTYIKYEQYDEKNFDPFNPEYKLGPQDRFIDMYCDEACMIQFASKYIDGEATDAANTITSFNVANDYSTDPDIDIDKVKKFRTWLAKELLTFDTSLEGIFKYKLFNEEVTHMLTYYKNGMYNDIVKYLSKFGRMVEFNTNKNGCTCCKAIYSDLNNLYDTSLTDCDALEIYRKNIYNNMVSHFSSLEFWNMKDENQSYALPREFILMIKKYIDNIIKCNLVINNKPTTISIYKECPCCSNQAYGDYNMEILKRLSQALYYIGTNTTGSHENYIRDALYDWASMLYEHMEW